MHNVLHFHDSSLVKWWIFNLLNNNNLHYWNHKKYSSGKHISLYLANEVRQHIKKCFPAFHTLTELAPRSFVSPKKHRLALFFNNASLPLNLEAVTQQDALMQPLFSSCVTVGSHVTASYTYLALLRERKQEMLTIAGLLCTLWEIMGAVWRGRDVPWAMFHISTSHPIHTVWTGSRLSCHRPHHSVSVPLQSGKSGPRIRTVSNSQ